MSKAKRRRADKALARELKERLETVHGIVICPQAQDLEDYRFRRRMEGYGHKFADPETGTLEVLQSIGLFLAAAALSAGMIWSLGVMGFVESPLLILGWIALSLIIAAIIRLRIRLWIALGLFAANVILGFVSDHSSPMDGLQLGLFFAALMLLPTSARWCFSAWQTVMLTMEDCRFARAIRQGKPVQTAELTAEEAREKVRRLTRRFDRCLAATIIAAIAEIALLHLAPSPGLWMLLPLAISVLHTLHVSALRRCAEEYLTWRRRCEDIAAYTTPMKTVQKGCKARKHAGTQGILPSRK